MENSEKELYVMENANCCRHATTDDIDDIYQITQEAFTQYAKRNGNFNIAALSETKEDIEVELEKKAIFIVGNGQEALATARCELIIEEEEVSIAYLSRFAVKTKAQHQGIGQIVLQEIIEFAKKAECKALCLHTSAKAFDLARFYYRNGFFVQSITTNRGYYRALFVHEFDPMHEVCDYATFLSNL